MRNGYASAQTDRRAIEPCKRLMAAVMQTVLDDCRGTLYRRSAGHGEPGDLVGIERALAYVASTDRVWPFSFENLCDVLDLDAGRLRKELRRKPPPPPPPLD